MRGFIVNNTGKSKHIFKRTVYPGGRVPLEDAYRLLHRKVPSTEGFLDWLDEYLPKGWEICVEEVERREELLAVPEVHSSGPQTLAEFCTKEDNKGLRTSTPEAMLEVPKEVDMLEDFTAKDIFNLRIKDNPKKVISGIDSVHKLRRALTLCKGDNRKRVLTSIIRKRIKELVDGSK